MLVSFEKSYSYKPMELKLRIASTRNPELPPYTKTYVVATNQKSHATTKTQLVGGPTTPPLHTDAGAPGMELPEETEPLNQSH
jgi:hypothetical protein